MDVVGSAGVILKLLFSSVVDDNGGWSLGLCMGVQSCVMRVKQCCPKSEFINYLSYIFQTT